jgi:regulator of protease activity HflC (stomatin/prohibitin superfamily)
LKTTNFNQTGESQTHFPENSFMISMRYLPPVITATIVILLILVFFQPLIFITINAGSEGVLYRRFAGGTVTDRTYKEGFHIVAPWNKMTIYDTRIQHKSYSLFVLTSEGLKTELDLSVLYYPRRNALGILHKEIGPDYLESVVIPVLNNTLRTLSGKITLDDLYTSKNTPIQSLITKSIAEIERHYVVIENVVIRQIILPKKLEVAIETKMEQKQLAIAAESTQLYNILIAKSLTPDVLKWKGIQATQALSESKNSKVVVVGNGGNQLPIILGGGNAQ